MTARQVSKNTLIQVYSAHGDTIMSENVDNLILEMLKGLRGEVKDFRVRYEEDMDDLKARMSSLESSMLHGIGAP